MDNDPAKYVPRLKWRKTWPDSVNDRVADGPLPGYMIGRFYRHDTGGINKGRWSWFYQADIPGLSRQGINLTGFADTPQEAAKAIEDAWFRAIEGKTLDVDGKRYVDSDQPPG